MTDQECITWGVSTAPRKPGDLLTRGDVCHLHMDRAAAERCGLALGGAPELVGLAEVRPAVYRVAWSLSHMASGRLAARPIRPAAPAACDHGRGCCTSCCPAEPDSTGTGSGCATCQPARQHGTTQRDLDGRAGFAALFGGES